MNKESFPLLNKLCIHPNDLDLLEKIKKTPVKILQIGEGNFLRGFFDWMVYQAIKQNLFTGSIAVTQPRPTGKGKIDGLVSQDGLFTVLTNGIQNGELIERKEIIPVFSKILNPYEDWQTYLDLAKEPELEFVVSNTTEAGLIYQPESYKTGQPILSYPGKLTVLLYERYKIFHGEPSKGLTMLPCELLERNGDTLRDCVLKYCQEWQLPESFICWIKEHNYFLNSLVDRIVPGYPRERASNFFSEWGYKDSFLTTVEPFYFWAIEGSEQLEQQLPLKKAGLNVHIVEDIRPYQLRKVRILNGAHTFMSHMGILHDLSEVRDVMEMQWTRNLIQHAVVDEIIPILPFSIEELMDYMNTVFERFSNPYMKHKLADISLNSFSKYKVRLLPTLIEYEEKYNQLPKQLIKSLSYLIRFFKVRQDGKRYVGQTLNHNQYEVKDDVTVLKTFAQSWNEYEIENASRMEMLTKLLRNERLWGRDLSIISGLMEAIDKELNHLEVRK